MDEFLLAAGVLLVLGSLRAFHRTRRFIASCHTADGHIAHYSTEKSEEGVHYYSRIRFRDRSNVEHEIRGSTGLQKPPKVGKSVRVTYDPANPTNAWITGSASPWVIPWLVLLLGLAVVVAGFIVRMEVA